MMRPWLFILDVDGVLTDGSFWYSEDGKSLKRFGPDDADALKLISPKLDLLFVSADKRGFPITLKRIQEDMGFELQLVPARRRATLVAANQELRSVAYMGDSFQDMEALSIAEIGIAPANANEAAKHIAQAVTLTNSGSRAVFAACVYLNWRLQLDIPELSLPLEQFICESLP